MKKKNIFLLLLSFWITSISIAQTTTSVCPGSTGTYEVNSPVAGSTYTWALKNGTGTLSTTKGSSITIVWKASSAADQITVIETNNAGCSGEPSLIEVSKYALPTAVFDKTSVCNGELLNVIITGESPFDASVTLPSGQFNAKSRFSDLNWKITATESGVYKLTEIKDKNCAVSIIDGTPKTTATIGSPLGKLTVKITPQ